MIKLLDFQESLENTKFIECPELSNNVIFKKYDASEGDVVKLLKNQFICAFEKGKILDIKENAGIYKLQNIDTKDEEFDNEWKNIIVRKAEEEKLCVLFFNTDMIKHNKYIISDPIKFKNWKNGEVSEIFINLEGCYDFKIENPKMMLSKVIGLRNLFTKQELIEKVRKYIICSIEEGINELSDEYKLDIDTLVLESDKLEIKLKQNEYDLKLLEYGIKLTYFDIKKFEINKKKFKFF